jgi:hypothetical protein
MGARRELFVDRFLIESLKDAELRLHHPTPAGPVLFFDQPWEGRWAGVVTMLHDDGAFRMYYRGMPSAGDGSPAECSCMAESTDGVRWTKPVLRLFEYRGSRENNIVLHGQPGCSHNLCPFVDRRPGTPASEWYKAVAGIHRTGIFAYASADGIHWRLMAEQPVLTMERFGFDSQNVAFWSAAEGCYVFYFRTFHEAPGSESRHGFRWVSRSTSDDFLHWSAPVEMDKGDAPWEEIYTQQTHPYFRAPHIYISLAARFQPRRQVVTPDQARDLDCDERYSHDCSDAVLMTSRGGARYDRTFLESFLRPGIGLGHWVSRTNYPALGVVPAGPTEMALYANRRYAQPSAYVERFLLRLDGFASLHAGYAGGEATLRPLRFTGRELGINFSTSAAGSVRVEVQDASGRPVPGLALEDCVEVIGDEIERVVRWKGEADLGRLAGAPVRLRFALKDADVFSFRFR